VCPRQYYQFITKTKKTRNSCLSKNYCGAHNQNRTDDLILTMDALYRLSYAGLIHSNGAGDGNRTHVISLEGWSSTIELHPLIVLTSNLMVEGGGFEPPKDEPSDLQSDPFGRSGTPPLKETHFP
jgi:hypothetical protein